MPREQTHGKLTSPGGQGKCCKFFGWWQQRWQAARINISAFGTGGEFAGNLDRGAQSSGVLRKAHAHLLPSFSWWLFFLFVSLGGNAGWRCQGTGLDLTGRIFHDFSIFHGFSGKSGFFREFPVSSGIFWFHLVSFWFHLGFFGFCPGAETKKTQMKPKRNHQVGPLPK